MDIAQQQTTVENIRLLAAQRHIYSTVKHLSRAHTIGVLALELVAPWLLLFRPDSKTVLELVGVVTAVVSRLVLGRIESERIRRAATIQEQFDVGLFGVPWNGTLVGRKVSPELIYAADRAFTGDRRALKDWYADVSGVPSPLDVLLCQRSNLVWGWRLQRSYAWVFNVVTFGYLCVGLLLGIVTHQSLGEYIAALVAPSLPALIESIEIAREHTEVAAGKEKLAEEVNALWEAGLVNPAVVSHEACRRVQDYIFTKRSRGPQVPDWWYHLWRKRYEVDMRAAVDELRAQAAQARAAH